ncbi:zinc ribbon domain-containing protein [Paenibacillus larvae]|nr:zinc ribbon domain-containing protein [Paenibacillus larvae]AQR78378.1 hypothetical protein BXP28_14715 [Paenibacillus larvae subsp. larvae]AVF20393.1 Double zinc ribbon [Paenibacillus larvae subsp. larvae]AVG10997.1 Double zinc ribbon [Paenibacillus larvae subsp. larvae DSM 25430]ETK28658.1 hypothetical protein ERIC1_1c21270 [Paenibacillus larvae subsp. larvae DSM 25719]MCY7477845.1 zinc ribbon domain-containing protein [Paenibacillus larvae]
MSGFLKKIKLGAEGVGKKAQQTFEANRLKIQIKEKQKEIEKRYTQIGREVYQAIKAQDEGRARGDVDLLGRQIRQLEEEIREMNHKILELNSEKNCPCGNVVPLETRYCPNCGHKFEEPVKVDEDKEALPDSEPEEELVELKRVCPSCRTAIDPDAKFCEHCGKIILPEE